jgi:pSer/pThr/pTyr-binding forkhead associated (FHA) protein
MSKFCIMSETNELRFFELRDEITFIGRSEVNDVRIKDNFVSREHLMLRKLGDRVLVRDLGSRNGTFVNGNPLRPGAEVEVKEGASIVVGMSVICLGKEGSDKVLALIGSMNPSNDLDDTDRLVSKKSELQSVEHKAKNLGSNLTRGTLHSSNIQVSKVID